MRKFMIQCKAELKRTIRNRRFLISSVLLPLAFYLFFTSTFGDQQVGGTTFSAYYMISMAVFGVMGGAVQTLSVRYAQERAQGWMKTLRITPVSHTQYILAKMFAQMVLSAIIIAVIFLAGLLVKHVDLSIQVWIESALWIWVGSLPFMALGILLGLVSGKASVQVISSGVYLILAMVGGLWMPIESFSKSMRSVSEWTPTYRFAHVVWNMIEGKSVHVQDIIVLLVYLALFIIVSTMISKRQEAVNA
ncbi:ABC transporter permease [Paenibacillus sediminis]|uniref:ABC-2 type transport system permease protein n=1 Tax=Paenibacillus sediminis TaxID=664909 RepID=A0ABS4H4B9_9BACL|nr:ABC transporter permease [Paenibacillus sediminis]MBP1937212.1 ABC-2 type transport system permease protein [Paenibacillus sediminis]